MSYKKLFFLFLVVIVAGGCYSLRKKFVRKKKDTQPQKVYIELREYPTLSLKQLYEDWYLFANAWLEEMIEGLRGDFNYKRQRYAFSEAVKNMEKIRKVFNAEGKKKIDTVYNELLSLEREISPFLSSIERNYLLQKIESIKIRFSKDFVYSKASQWIEKN